MEFAASGEKPGVTVLPPPLSLQEREKGIVGVETKWLLAVF
jgi:hypothetical protein